jgi:4-hydroxy-3-polyprenylbenzoate decarboxylase
MTKVTETGAVIMPPMPAFYHRPGTIMEIVRQSVGRALDHVGIEHDVLDRWSGP